MRRREKRQNQASANLAHYIGKKKKKISKPSKRGGLVVKIFIVVIAVIVLFTSLFFLAYRYLPYDSIVKKIFVALEDEFDIKIKYSNISLSIQDGLHASGVVIKDAKSKNTIAEAETLSLIFSLKEIWKGNFRLEKLKTEGGKLYLEEFSAFYQTRILVPKPPKEGISINVVPGTFEFNNTIFMYGAIGIVGTISISTNEIKASIESPYARAGFYMLNGERGEINIEKINWKKLLPFETFTLFSTEVKYSSYLPEKLRLSFVIKDSFVFKTDDIIINTGDNSINGRVRGNLNADKKTLLASIENGKVFGRKFYASAALGLEKLEGVIRLNLDDYLSLSVDENIEVSVMLNIVYNLKEGLSGSALVKDSSALISPLKKPILIDSGIFTFSKNVLLPYVIEGKCGKTVFKIVGEKTPLENAVFNLSAYLSEIDIVEILDTQIPDSPYPILPEINATVMCTNIKYAPFVFENIEAFVSAKDEKINLNIKNASIARGDIRATYTFENPKHRVNLTATNISVMEILKTITGKTLAFGTGVVSIEGEVEDVDIMKALSTAKADFSATVSKGSILSNEYLYEIYKKMGRGRQTPRAEYFDFIKVDGQLRKGKLDIEKLTIEGEDKYWNLTEGYYNFSNNTYEISGRFLFSEHFRDTFLPNVSYGLFPKAKDKEGWYELPPFIVTKEGNLIFEQR